MDSENHFFSVIQYRVQVGEDFFGKGLSSSEATVKVQIKKRDSTTEVVHGVAEGNGPVNALDNVLRKVLNDFFPEIAKVCLVDYEVHKGNSGEGTDCLVEVTITSSDGENKWVTRECSTNIIRASLIALVKSLETEILALENSRSVA